MEEVRSSILLSSTRMTAGQTATEPLAIGRDAPGGNEWSCCRRAWVRVPERAPRSLEERIMTTKTILWIYRTNLGSSIDAGDIVG